MAPPAVGDQLAAARREIPGANDFGLVEALIGLAAAELLATLAVAAFAAASGHPNHASSFGSELADLAGIWAGLFGAVVLASALRRRRSLGSPAAVLRLLRDDYGLAIRWWPDVPLGILVGVAGQYVAEYVFEAPLLPFVPHLYRRLGGPAHQLTGVGHGASLAILGVFLCLGSPFFEECFFRGLLLRALLGQLAGYGRRIAEVGAVVGSGLIFGLYHFEPLELLGLAGFGMLLAVLARRTGRLGPSIVAHVAFNAVTVISIALAR